MRKRLLCGFLTLLLLLQVVPMETYAVENNPVQQVTEETESSVEPDTTEVPSTVEEETTEMTVVEEETTTTEETTVSEEEPTDTEEITVEEETTVEDASTEEESTVEETTDENDGTNGILSDETEKPAEIKNLRVESVGYQKAMLVFEVECKEGVDLSSYGGVVCSESTLSSPSDAQFGKYRNAQGEYIENQYYMRVKVHPGTTYSYTPYIFIWNEDGIKEKISSETSINITGCSFDTMNPRLEIEAFAGAANVKILQDNYFDSEKFEIEVFSRKKGETEWETTNNECKWEETGGICNMYDLAPGCTYETYFVIKDTYGLGCKAETEIYTFTTEEDKEYSQSDFPDEVFYYHLLERYIHDTKITQSALDQISSISISILDDETYEITEPVRSIEGIQYMRNLDSIGITGQDIEDISAITGLTKLKYIDFSSNCIAKIPDMSKLEKLDEIYLDSNYIPKSEFTKEKFSQSFWNNHSFSSLDYWQSMQLNKQVDIIEIPVCFSYEDTIPFVCGVDNLRSDMEYRMVLSIDGKEIGNKERYCSFAYLSGISNMHRTKWEIGGLEIKKYENAKVEIYDYFNRKVAEKTYDFEIQEGKSKIYIDGLTTESDRIDIDAILEEVTQEVTNIEVTKNGNIYGQVLPNSLYQTNTSCDTRYEEIFSDNYTSRNAKQLSGMIAFEKPLEKGTYDIRFTLEDESELIFENEITLDDSPVVFSVNKFDYYNEAIYDSYGEYIYIEVTGKDIDCEKIHPQLLSEENPATENPEVIDAWIDYDAIEHYIYRLKKLDSVDWENYLYLKWELQPDTGYVLEDWAQTHWLSYLYPLYTDGIKVRILWIDEEKENNKFTFYLNNEKLDGKEVTVTALSRDDIKIASGKGVVNKNIISLDFYDKNGNLWIKDSCNYELSYNDNGKIVTYDLGSISKVQSPQIFSGSSKHPLTGKYINLYGTGKTLQRIKIGTEIEPSIVINCFLPENNEKVLSLNLTKEKFDEYGIYALTKEDVKDLQEGQVYRVEISDRDGERRLKRFYSYLSSSTTSTSQIKPSKITLNKTSLTLGIGETGQLKATVSPTNATNKSVTWKSSDETVATVDNTGKITAVAEGTAVITASTYNGLQAKCNITVYQSEGESITLKPEEEYTISIPGFVNAKTAKFTSLDTDVAKVSSNGVVSGTGLGETKVILQSGSIKITYPVTVINPLTSIRFEEDNLSVEVGENVTNAIIFTPALTESSKDLSATVEDESVASAEVSGRNIRVQGIKAGTTKITANVGDLSAECQITVLSPIEVPQLSETEVYAFVNRDKKLGDLEEQLPEGFRFAEPETLLAQFTGVSEKEFAVIYTDETGRQKESVQKVRFVTISGISVEAEKTSVAADGKDKSIISVDCEWTGYEAPEEKKEEFLNEYTFELSLDKTDIAAIEQDNDLYVLKGLSKGKATVTAVLRKAGTQGKDGILFKKTLGILVTEKVVNLQVSVTGAEYNSEKDYYVVENISDANVVVEGTAEEYKVKWSSSDTAVATIGKTTGNQTSVTIKSNGKVKLTATANDPAKTSKSIMLYVIDTKPSIDGQITINKALEGGGTMGIYASYGYQIEQYDVQIMQAQNEEQSDNRFSIDYNATKDVYEVCLADGADVKEGKYDVIIRVTANTENGKKTYCEKAVITVVNKPVTYSVKQSKKVNLFYSDEEGNGVLTISCKNAVIQSAELSDCDFSYDYETGEISFTGDNYENPDEEGVLTITFEGYKEVSKNINISSEVKKPKITTSASSSVIYPNAGVKTAKIQLNDATSGKTLVISNGNINQENLENDAYKAYAQDGEVCYALRENVTNYPASAKITFKLQMSNWNDEIAISHTIKSNMASNLSVILSNGTVTLNKNDILAKYQSEEVSMKVKNATETAIDTVEVAGADKKSVSAMNQGLDFAFDDETGKLAVWFNDSSKVDTGTYTYSLSANIEEGSKAKTKLKVKVLDKEPEKTVTVSAKGTIDIIDRKNTSVVCTAKFTNISGKIADVKLTGQDAHLFEVSLNEKNQAVIKAREDVAYITKYPYKVQLAYTLNSGSRDYRVTSKPLSLKLKQGKASITANLTSIWFYQAADNAINVEITVMNSKGNNLEISDVTLAETKDLKGAFTLAYDETAQCYKLAIQDSGKVKKNKTYTLKLNVRTKEQADNEKPISVSVKVKVK